ncbi:MAG TPA: DUF4349 domain-containing protein [Anaerolineae bacterium]|nr:DUF4349 domain-containing protein [Anaerolineae bacterium]
MKRFFKSSGGAYLAIAIGLGLIILVIAALLGPTTGNIFSNIYANAPGPYLRPSAESKASSAAQPTLISAAKSSGLLASPYRANRLIIKNSEMNLLVADADQAVDRIVAIAVNSGGYVIGSRSWLQDNFKYAALTIGVPSDQFEVVQRQVRAVGVQALSDTSSGQDVSDEYVDLQARQTNLEATAARIREFLDQAKDAEQALLVNTKLTEVEAELEQIKGRMAYLKDRSAYSTMTINLEPQRPTPTPTPTATPAAWLPEKTFNAATGALSTVLSGLGDVAIWLIAFIAPLAIPVALVAFGASWLRRKREKRVARHT